MAIADSKSDKTDSSAQLISGADIVVEGMIRQGVDVIFAYPGGASMPLHQALTQVLRSDSHNPAPS